MIQRVTHGERCAVYFTGRNIRRSNAVKFAHAVNRHDEIIGIRRKHSFIRNRAGSVNLNYVSFYYSLGGGGIFKLLADGYLVALCNKSSYV